MILAFLLGAAAWTLAEYGIHRVVFHVWAGRTGGSRDHLHHHRDTTWFAPSAKKAWAAAVILTPLALVAWALAGAAGLAFTAGFAVAYVAYEVTHRRVHTHPPRGPYSRWTRRHHLYHHHRDATANHGVTTPVWDWVFGTLGRAERIKVPRSRAPGWMVDEQGELLAAWADDYVLVGPRRQAARSGS